MKYKKSAQALDLANAIERCFEDLFDASDERWKILAHLRLMAWAVNDWAPNGVDGHSSPQDIVI